MITEIDISKQSRAFAWFRRTEYSLMVLWGLPAISLEVEAELVHRGQELGYRYSILGPLDP